MVVGPAAASVETLLGNNRSLHDLGERVFANVKLRLTGSGVRLRMFGG